MPQPGGTILSSIALEAESSQRLFSDLLGKSLTLIESRSSSIDDIKNQYSDRVAPQKQSFHRISQDRQQSVSRLHR